MKKGQSNKSVQNLPKVLQGLAAPLSNLPIPCHQNLMIKCESYN